jgi:hypothetical protein
VGFDCVDGESFGSDTIRLKENQLRIHFMDTSVSPFPSNDWRLIANDPGSGGSNFFAIEDSTAARQVFKVTAGAAANSLFVGSNSKVGLRTSTPVLDLHINTSDTPAHRLEQNNSGGFSAQTWDIAGNEANFFVRDVTGGSRLPFRRPGAPTSSIDISADGDVGVGTASPGARLHVVSTVGGDSVRVAGSQNPGLNLITNSANAAARNWGISENVNIFGDFVINQSANNTGVPTTTRLTILDGGNVGIGVGNPAAKMDVNGTIRAGTLNNNPAANTMCFSASNVLGNCTSDRRLKRDVEYLDGHTGLAAVMRLKPAAFRWHDGDDRLMAGFVAQDTEGAIPAAVHRPAGSEFLALDTGAVLAYAVKAIQELKADNEDLRAELARLKTAR